MNLVQKANYQKINTELSKNNYFLDQLNSIKFELDIIYRAGNKKAKLIQEIRKIQIDLDMAEKAIENIEFLDLFDENIFKTDLIVSKMSKKDRD